MVRVGSSFLPGGSGLWQQLTTPRAAATVCAFSGPFRIFKRDFFKSYNFESQKTPFYRIFQKKLFFLSEIRLQ